MVHMAIKVEQQLKQRNARASRPKGQSSWKSSYAKKEDKPIANLKAESKPSSSTLTAQGKIELNLVLMTLSVLNFKARGTLRTNVQTKDSWYYEKMESL